MNAAELVNAVGGVLGGLGAIAAAAVAIVAIRRQDRSHQKALEAQSAATNEALRHERKLAADDRMWARRADLYMRLMSAMRACIADDARAGDVPALLDLASEVEVLADTHVRDLVNQFVFNDPDVDEKINLWAEVQIACRSELGSDGTPPTSGDSHGD